MSIDREFRGGLETLEAEYEIIERLGRGGTAVVYLARDRELGREVAVKLIREQHLEDEEALARFEREAHTLAQLQHANIVAIYGARRLEDGTLALVLQHMRGRTLKRAIQEDGPFAPDRAERVIRDIAEALVCAHSRGIVHRDVKPENIFLDETDGRALLSDFGIAKLKDGQANVTLTGVVIGTPAYMAPEQIDGRKPDGRSDLYSLGLVGYEMLTGRRPWEGENLYSTIYKQKHEELPPLRDLCPGLPPHLLQAVDTALSKDPERRWASAGDLIARLDDAQQPLPAPVLAGAGEAAGDSPRDETHTIAFEPALAAAEDALRDTTDEGPADRNWMFAAAAVVLLFVGGGVIVPRIGASRSDAQPTDRLAFVESTRAPGAAMGTANASDERAERPSPESTNAAGGELARPSAARASAARPQNTPSPGTEARPSATTPTEAAPTPPPASDRLRPAPADPAPVPEAVVEDPALSFDPAMAVGVEPVRNPAIELPPLASPAIAAAAPEFTPDALPPELRNPADVRRALKAAYPPELRSRGVDGTTHVRLAIDTAGRVVEKQIATSSGEESLDAAALDVVEIMEFSPGQQFGRTIAMTVTIPVVFQAVGDRE